MFFATCGRWIQQSSRWLLAAVCLGFCLAGQAWAQSNEARALAEQDREQAGQDRQSPQRAFIRDPRKTFRTYVWSYKEIRERNIVMQKYDYSCGAAVLATIGRYYWGDNVNEVFFLDLLPKLRLTPAEMKDRIDNGLSLTDLRDLANLGGYDATMGRVPPESLENIKVPVIVGITVNKYDPKNKHDHYVVLRGTDGQFIYLADPIRGNLRLPIDDFLDQWQLNALLAIAKPNMPIKEVNPLAIRNDEIERGLLNEQTVRRNALTFPIVNPLQLAR
jgi:predicted double-glycine peptidase